jgi:hypothetical protein
MEFGWTKAASKVFAGAICGVGVVALTCGGPTAPAKSGPPLDSLVVTNQISGWSPADTGISYFNDNTIYNLVDGGNSTYCGTCTNDTLIEGYRTYMSKVPQGTDTEQLKMFVVQYANPAFVQMIFAGDSVGSSFEPESALAPYSISEVFYTNNGSTIHAFGHFNNFLVELNFTQYASGAAAVSDASTFMNYFHSKIGQ